MTLWPITTAARIAWQGLKARIRLWRLERTLYLLDWEIDDADMDLIDSRGDPVKRALCAAQVNYLHTQRKPVVDEILGLRVVLGIPTHADLFIELDDPFERPPMRDLTPDETRRVRG